MALSVVKRNKRLVIIDQDDKIVYCPPNFLRPFMRHHLEALISDSGYLSFDELVAFEDHFNPRKKRL